MNLVSGTLKGFTKTKKIALILYIFNYVAHYIKDDISKERT